MLIPNRNYSSPSYRYGFQGQEKDDEVKGNGNSINYKFRMHDPRVGRFFAIDPLVKKYPWYSPYQFSGNTPIMSTELEGLEPRVKKGVLVGYTVMAGQGPSQISLDINDPATQKEYGYTLQKPVTWDKVVMDNVVYYAKAGGIDNWNGTNMLNIDNPVYKNLNSSVGDILEVSLIKDSEKTITPKPLSRVSTPKMHLLLAGYDISAGIGGGGVGASGYKSTPIPKDSPVWGASRSLVFASINGGAGTPGFDTGFQFGTLNIYENNNPSLTNVLSGSSITKSGGFIWPNGLGAKAIGTFSKEYSVTTAGPVAGKPGVIYSTSISQFGISGVRLDPPMSEADSIGRAKEWMRQYKNDSVPANFLIRKGEIKDVKIKD